MARRIIERIRQKVRLRQYDLTAHATEEMAEDNLDIFDVEEAIFNGEIARPDKDDPRGTKYHCRGKSRGSGNTRWSCRPVHWYGMVFNNNCLRSYQLGGYHHVRL